MTYSKLMPTAQKLCEQCQLVITAEGLACPYIFLDGGFCPAVVTISNHEKSLARAIKSLEIGGGYKNGGLPYRFYPETE